MAVAKRQPMDRIRNLLNAGHRIFGENRVQEAQTKWPDLREEYPDIELHLVGPLQTNKVPEAVALFDVIQSVDRTKLAAKLGEEMTKTGKSVRLMVQVNTGEEAQKSGIAPSSLGELISYCHETAPLKVEGLMCLPPLVDEPTMHFALLAKLAREHGLPALSMGMSADFEQAVHFGATHVRVGTALFGPRDESRK